MTITPFLSFSPITFKQIRSASAKKKQQIQNGHALRLLG